jgi:hypothetical protein
MSSKIFPPRLVPSADDPLREDREAEVDASSVVCLVFVASRSSIVVDAFFFSKIHPANTKGRRTFFVWSTRPFFPQKSSLPLTRFFPHCRTTTTNNKQIIRTTKEKKTPEFKIAGKAKETSSRSARARERAHRKYTHTHVRA